MSGGGYGKDGFYYIRSSGRSDSSCNIMYADYSQITKYEKKYHSPLIFMELYPKPIALKCMPELYAKWMGEEHQHDTQENEHDER